MQLQIGTFSFTVDAGGAEYANLRRVAGRRWVERQRHGRPPALEDLGRAAATLTLSGTVWIRSGADLAALDGLRDAAGLAAPAGLDAGAAVEPPSQPLPLFSGVDAAGAAGASTRTFWGWWVITRLTERHRQLRVDGIPARIDFSVSLTEHADRPAGAAP